MSRRIDRVNVLLRQEISRVLTVELSDPRLASVVSITHVDSSSDLRHAKVFVSVLGDLTAKLSIRSIFGWWLKKSPSVNTPINCNIDRWIPMMKKAITFR